MIKIDHVFSTVRQFYLSGGAIIYGVLDDVKRHWVDSIKEGGLMDNLKKSIMGKYNAEDVDKLLKKVRSDYEKCLKEQKERIIQLREEKKEMETMVEKYQNNERYIIAAITKAEETAQSIISDAEKKAKKRIQMAENEERQIKMAAEGCYKRLCNLRKASEAIFRAVTTVLGAHETNDDMERNTGHIRAVRSVYDGTH